MSGSKKSVSGGPDEPFTRRLKSSFIELSVISKSLVGGMQGLWMVEILKLRGTA